MATLAVEKHQGVLSRAPPGLGYRGEALLQSATCRWMYYNARTLESEGSRLELELLV